MGSKTSTSTLCQAHKRKWGLKNPPLIEVSFIDYQFFLDIDHGSLNGNPPSLHI